MSVSATNVRTASATIAISSALSYRTRGQKNPRRPSLRRRGTTWTWRCATLWLTTLFMATNEPSADERGLHGHRHALHAREERPDELGGEVAQGDDVDAGDDEHVPLEHRTVIEEPDRHLVVQHHLGRLDAGDHGAEETLRHRRSLARVNVARTTPATIHHHPEVTD